MKQLNNRMQFNMIHTWHIKFQAKALNDDSGKGSRRVEIVVPEPPDLDQKVAQQKAKGEAPKKKEDDEEEGENDEKKKEHKKNKK